MVKPTLVSPPYNSGATQIGSLGPGTYTAVGWTPGGTTTLSMLPNTTYPVNPPTTMITGAAGSTIYNPYNGGMPPAVSGLTPHLYTPPVSPPTSQPTAINSGWQIQIENYLKAFQNWFASLFASPSQSSGTNPTPPVPTSLPPNPQMGP